MNHPSRTGGALVEPATPAHLLRAHAAGLLAQTAAVDLLIAHRYWLTRSAFTDRFVHPVTTHDGRQSGAWIDWAAAIAALQRGELPCSASEASMLRIAAALGADLPLSLRAVLGGLDATNIAAVTTAITTAITTANRTRP
jgi:hypothetical protein